MDKEWEKEGRREKARLVLEEFVLHSGRIEGKKRRGEATGDAARREVHFVREG